MRMSCNGCRVLRKGCSEDCSIKPCLQWIKNPESQANATVFLAKFYGRAGLMNLINAGPEHLRPAIFRSLLYEACGRIVNPIYGSVGLLWSGNWQLCQNAVEAALKGAPITQIASEAAETNNGPPLKAYDIRHVSKEEKEKLSGSNDLHRVRTRCRFKRSGMKIKDKSVRVGSGNDSSHEDVNHRSTINEEVNRSPSHHSSLSHQSEESAPNAAERESRDSEISLVSVETAEAEAVVRAEPESFCKDDNQRTEDGEIELELTLGFEPFSSRSQNIKPKQIKRCVAIGSDNNNDKMCKMELGLDYPA